MDLKALLEKREAKRVELQGEQQWSQRHALHMAGAIMLLNEEIDELQKMLQEEQAPAPEE